MDLATLRRLPWRRPSRRAVLVAHGADARGLLHRISTRELEDLAPGEARATLFCDFRGRLLHRAVALAQTDHLLLLRDDDAAASLLAWIERHVFREDFRLEDRSSHWRLDAAWGDEVSRSCEADSLEVRGSRKEEGFTLVRPAERLLWAVGESSALERAIGTVPPWGPAEERQRVEAGWPAQDHEIRDEFHPFEVGLAHEVHLSKGCYTGQEALQRLVTYRSARRRLALIRGQGPAPQGMPMDLWDGTSRGGRLTSVAPAADRWLGLGVLPRNWEESQVGPLGEAPTWSFAWLKEKLPLGRAL